MKNPFKLSVNENLVKSYKLFEARKNTQTSNVSLFITTQRVIVYEEIKDLLGVGKKVHEYDINDIDELYTNVQKRISIIPKVIFFIISIFLFLSLGKYTVWPGIITLLIAIGLGVLAVVFPKSAGVIRFKTKTNRFILSEVTSLSVKLLSVNQGIIISNYKLLLLIKNSFII